MSKCIKCGCELFSFDEMYGDSLPVCDECLYEEITTADCLNNGEVFKEEIELNSFLRYVYTKDEIEQLILRDFEKMEKRMQRQYIREYASKEMMIEDLAERKRGEKK